MGSTFGRFLTISTFGESHGAGLGVVMDGVPAGLHITEAMIQRDMDRRRPGQNAFVTQRKEGDKVEILSGIDPDGMTLGTPIGMLIRNWNARSQDYNNIRDYFRPGHADYTYFKKYGTPLQPGGGRSSGRETVGRVAAGAIARQILGESVKIESCVTQVGTLLAEKIDWEFAETHPIRFADPDLAKDAEDRVSAVMAVKDSLGGVVSLRATGVPAGLGDPAFYKLDACLGMAMMSIGAVKGMEIGDGFNVCCRRGSENNDPILADGFASNSAGGILGGISNGDTINLRLAVKPTASIALPQQTINAAGEEVTIEVKGRHDPFLSARIGPVAESMIALTLADAMLEQRAHAPMSSPNTSS